MVVVGRPGDVYFAVCFGQFVLALRCGHAQHRRAIVRAVVQGLRLQVFELHRHALVIEIAGHVEIFRHSLIAQKLPQTYQRLSLGQLRHRYVALKLQQL